MSQLYGLSTGLTLSLLEDSFILKSSFIDQDKAPNTAHGRPPSSLGLTVAPKLDVEGGWPEREYTE
jgi:hypothetical protein